MTATKLIQKLAQAVADFGDLEVLVERDGPPVEDVGRKDYNIILYVPDGRRSEILNG